MCVIASKGHCGYKIGYLPGRNILFYPKLTNTHDILPSIWIRSVSIVCTEYTSLYLCRIRTMVFSCFVFLWSVRRIRPLLICSTRIRVTQAISSTPYKCCQCMWLCACVFNAMRSIRPGAQYGSRNRHTFNAQMPVHLETPNIQSKAYSSFQPYISFSASEFKCTIKKRRAVHSAFSCSLSFALFIYNIGVMVLLRRKQNSILSFVPYEFAFCMDTSFNIQR